MRKILFVLVALALSATLSSYFALAQQQPQQPMSFFVTSIGPGNGANLGDLAGADAHCQMLATAVGAGSKTWRAYLSTQGPGAVNARDRIGSGPWFNAKRQRIARNVGDLHGDTLEQARIGNTLTRITAIDEKGDLVEAPEYQPIDALMAAATAGSPWPDYGELTYGAHDILTGSRTDGTTYTDNMDHTCNNWTSDSTGSAQVGHHDRGAFFISWNSAHGSRGCSEEDLTSTGSAGLFYCFAIN